ncbi:MAG: outer membrane beta-barrel protein, partial [Phenylobacterium sp.]
RIDVLRQARINASVDASHNTEPRTSANSPATATKPVEYDLVAFALGGDREFNRLRVSGRFDSSTYDYTSPRNGAGAIIDQKFRDRTVSSLKGRADYAVSPATAVFAEIIGNKHSYDRQPPAVTLNRDSDGVQALAGVNFELGALTRGEVAVGYIQQTFDDPTMRKLDGLGARARVEWFPSELTTVTFNASRSVEDSAVGNSAGYLATDIGAQVDHEFLRNFIVTGKVGYGKDKYTGIVREDRRMTAGVAGTYLINHNLGLTVSYDYSDQDTRKGTGADFTVNKVGATLTVQY